MDKQIWSATVGGLLHDIGKVVYRSGKDGKSHAISGSELMSKLSGDTELLQCVQYHHKKDLIGAPLRADHPAYAVYLADNIASGTD